MNSISKIKVTNSDSKMYIDYTNKDTYCNNFECPLHPVNHNSQNIFCDGKNRFNDMSKFITDSNQLKIEDETYVYISKEKDYDIAIDLEERISEFEKLKPYIVSLEKHICELDKMAQNFYSLEHKHNSPILETGTVRYHYLKTVGKKKEKEDFSSDLAIIYFNDYFDNKDNVIRFDYWCTDVASTFDVVFEYKSNMFHLIRFGIIDGITDDWEQVFMKEFYNKDEDI